MANHHQILGIETSCDECSAAVIEAPEAPEKSGFQVRSLETFSQTQLHKPYGGVVPEIASRNHLETIDPMIDQALEKAQTSLPQIDAISVSNRPGLVGSLLVGVSAAKALAYAFQKPLIPLHHLEGHAASVFLNTSPELERLRYPVLLAIVSGGHTNLYVAENSPRSWPMTFLKEQLIGRSLDDAAGEAFDKTAKLLGFPYPGGVALDQNAQGGDPHAFHLPRALKQKNNFNFSFSGLKTATALLIRKLESAHELEANSQNLCASIQEAIVDALLDKIQKAIQHFQCQSLVIVGGVAANSRLRERLNREIQVPVCLPPLAYCTDNGAMIAAAGYFRWRQGHYPSETEQLSINALASASY